MSKALYDHDVAPPHPGEILREDLMPLTGMTRAELARHLGIPARRLSKLLSERLPVTLDLAQRLGAALGHGTRYWLGLQIQHDIWCAEHGATPRVKPVVYAARPRSAPAASPPRQVQLTV